MLNTEQVIYIARKLKWSREEIGKLHPLQAIELYNELCYQESQEDYRVQYNVATILAAIQNTIPRKGGRVSIYKDFLKTEPPSRGGGELLEEIELLAKEKGIILPSK